MTVPGTPRTAREQAEISLGLVSGLGRMSRFYREAREAFGRGEFESCVSLCESAQDRGHDFGVKYGEG